MTALHRHSHPKTLVETVRARRIACKIYETQLTRVNRVLEEITERLAKATSEVAAPISVTRSHYSVCARSFSVRIANLHAVSGKGRDPSPVRARPLARRSLTPHPSRNRGFRNAFLTRLAPWETVPPPYHHRLPSVWARGDPSAPLLAALRPSAHLSSAPSASRSAAGAAQMHRSRSSAPSLPLHADAPARKPSRRLRPPPTRSKLAVAQPPGKLGRLRASQFADASSLTLAPAQLARCLEGGVKGVLAPHTPPVFGDDRVRSCSNETPRSWRKDSRKRRSSEFGPAIRLSSGAAHWLALRQYRRTSHPDSFRMRQWNNQPRAITALNRSAKSSSHQRRLRRISSWPPRRFAPFALRAASALFVFAGAGESLRRSLSDLSKRI